MPTDPGARTADPRRVGDPVADRAIASIVEADQVEAVNLVMRTLIENDDLPTGDLPDAIDRYLEATRTLPEWAEPERLDGGSEIFERYGPEIVLMLFGASLPMIYASHPACEVLGGTRRMTHHVHRRIIETGQFVIDVTEPGAWSPEGRGILSCQKVRLMHAAIRHYLARDERWSEHWRADWAVPICQEDLLGTMLSFSVTVIESLVASNITLNAREREDYLHLWKVVGFLLGIDEERLPDDYPAGVAMMEDWRRRTHRPTETSRALMQAMIAFWYERVPGRIFDGVTSGWCRLWVGDELADRLGVPPFDWTRHLLRLQTTLWKYEDRLADSVLPFRWLTRVWSRKLLRALMALERDGRRPDFRIPRRLQRAWGVG